MYIGIIFLCIICFYCIFYIFCFSLMMYSQYLRIERKSSFWEQKKGFPIHRCWMQSINYFGRASISLECTFKISLIREKSFYIIVVEVILFYVQHPTIQSKRAALCELPPLIFPFPKSCLPLPFHFLLSLFSFYHFSVFLVSLFPSDSKWDPHFQHVYHSRFNVFEDVRHMLSFSGIFTKRWSRPRRSAPRSRHIR